MKVLLAFLDFAENLGRAGGHVDLEPAFVLVDIERVGYGEMMLGVINVTVSAKPWAVGVENDFIFTLRSEHAVVGE